MYFAQSGRGSVEAFPYDRSTGNLGPASLLVQSEGFVPDGLAVDSAGAVWIAGWRTAELRRYAPSGRLDAIVKLPVDQVTSCAFGGADYRTLFITTGREGLGQTDLQRQPHAGSLFAFVADTPGLAASGARLADFDARVASTASDQPQRGRAGAT